MMILKNNSIMKKILAIVMIFCAVSAFAADVTDDVQSDTVLIRNDIAIPDDKTEPDGGDIIREVLQFGIDSEVTALLSEI
ncbi:MAG: hypothetical protein IKP67_01255, partial [Spirochaetales bacterium]|nr:hypothetical protein [Spirochaetales bacterium]